MTDISNATGAEAAAIYPADEQTIEDAEVNGRVSEAVQQAFQKLENPEADELSGEVSPNKQQSGLITRLFVHSQS